MTTNDIDATRHRWRELQNAPQPGLVTTRLIIAEQSADDVPALCDEVEQLRRDLADLAEQLDQAEAARDRYRRQLADIRAGVAR